MTKKKKKNRKKGKGNGPQKPPAAELRPPGRDYARMLDYSATAVFVLLLVVFSVKCFGYAANTIFWSDECYHAYFAEQFASFHYPQACHLCCKGLAYHVTPLSHHVDAVWIMIFGKEVLYYINICYFILVAVAGFLLVWKYRSLYEAQIFGIMLFAAALFGKYALRYYQEMITTAVMLFFIIFLYCSMKKERRRYDVLAGVFLGLLILTKQTGLVVGAALFIFFAVSLVLRKREWIVRFFIIGGLGALISAPYFIKNMILFHHPLIPVPDITPVAAKIQAMTVLQPFEFNMIKLTIQQMGLLYLVSFVFITVYYARRFYKTRTMTPETMFTFFFVLTILLSYAGYIIGKYGSSYRHYLAFLPFIALSTAMAVKELFGEKVGTKAFLLAILACYSGYVVYDLPDYRRGKPGERSNPLFVIGSTKPVPSNNILGYFDKPFTVIDKLRREPDNSFIVSLHSYTIFYHTKKSTTWATWQSINNSQIPNELFFEKDPDKFYQIARKYGVTHIMIDKWRFPVKQDPVTGQNVLSDKWVFNKYPPWWPNILHRLVKENKAEIFYDGTKDAKDRYGRYYQSPIMVYKIK